MRRRSRIDGLLVSILRIIPLLILIDRVRLTSVRRRRSRGRGLAESRRVCSRSLYMTLGQSCAGRPRRKRGRSLMVMTVILRSPCWCIDRSVGAWGADGNRRRCTGDRRVTRRIIRSSRHGGLSGWRGRRPRRGRRRRIMAGRLMWMRL